MIFFMNGKQPKKGIATGHRNPFSDGSASSSALAELRRRQGDFPAVRDHEQEKHILAITSELNRR